MRVTCPSCKAVYEASDSELGAGGRRVECSACNAQWFQPGPTGTESGSADGPKMPGMEDAARDMAELTGPRASGPSSPPPRASLGEGLDARTPSPAPESLAPRRPAPMAPSTLASDLRSHDREADRVTQEGSSFALGFILAVAICGVAAGAYIGRDKIVETVPETAPALESYARTVDDLRLEIEDLAEQVKTEVDAMQE